MGCIVVRELSERTMIGGQHAGEGRVLSFSAPPRRMKRPPQAGDAVRGTILLFTGVRYQRMGEESGAAPERAGVPVQRQTGA